MTEPNEKVLYRPMTAADHAAVIRLANEVHGDNYLNEESLADYAAKGTVGDVNLNWLAWLGDELIGIRLTFAPGTWPIDDQCTPAAWPVAGDYICYFKCAAVAEQARGLGVGRGLLEHSIAAAKQLGCQAGLAHIWRQSPNNSAFSYFSKCGGQLIREHKKRWYQLSVEEGYHCPVCDGVCYCTAAEMILPFNQTTAAAV
ncbi:MAG: GNAT family N-acetyltransferase [Idiomarina sp.]